MRRFVAAAVAIVALGLVGTASADVTFDPLTGTGFVPKSAVEAALGWNDATYRANVANLVFTWQGRVGYTGQCLLLQGPPAQHRTITWGGPDYLSTATLVGMPTGHGHQIGTSLVGVDPAGTTLDFPWKQLAIGSTCPDANLIFNSVISATYVTQPQTFGSGTLSVNGVALLSLGVPPS
jgi:hypothetical protein